MDEHKESCLVIEGTIIREDAGYNVITLTVDHAQAASSIRETLKHKDTTYSRPLSDSHIIIKIDKGTLVRFEGAVCPSHALPPLVGRRINARGFLSQYGFQDGNVGCHIKILTAAISRIKK
jgi:hypothetical protein